jgi:hypothetical protein
MPIPILAGFARAAMSGASRGILGGLTGSRAASVSQLLSGFGDSFQRGGHQGANLLDGALRRAAEVANNSFVPMLKDVLPAGLSKLAESTVALTNTFIARGKELERYSGVLTQTNALNDLKATLADIKEARLMEDSMAKVSGAANNIWLEVREIMLPIKKVLVDHFGRFLGNIEERLEANREFTARVSVAISVAMTFFAAMTPGSGTGWQDFLKKLDTMPEQIAEAMKREDNLKDLSMEMFHQMIDGALQNLNRNAPPLPPNDGGRLGLPVFGF